MSSEEIFLKRIDHSQSFLQFFERLLQSSSLVDCTIAAEGQYLKAHRVILAACSSYFEMLFSKESEKNPIVVFKGMKFEDLKNVVEFSYRGHIKIPKSQLTSFVNTAECLEITGIENDISKQIVEMSSEEICLKRVNHPQSFLQFLERSLESSSCGDCTLVAEEQHLRAHRVILAACSPYFELLFCEGNEKAPFVVLTDTKFKDLKALVDIAYRGQIKIPESQLRSFDYTAESLQIGGVEVDCSVVNMKCVVNGEDELPLALNRGNCTSHAAHKQVRKISSSAYENVSQQLCAITDTVNCVSTTDGKVVNNFSAETWNHFCSADGNAWDKPCAAFEGASKELCAPNANHLSEQAVRGNVSASKQSSTNDTNFSICENYISDDGAKCSHFHVPGSMALSCKSEFPQFDGNVSPSCAVHLPPPSTHQSHALRHRLPDAQPKSLGGKALDGNLPAVKTEQEPEPENFTEIFTSESECFTEPKNEVVVEELSVSEREEENPKVANAGFNNQGAPNQCAVFIGTADACSEDSFILPHCVESSSRQDPATSLGIDNSRTNRVVPTAIEQTQMKPLGSDDFKPISMEIATSTTPSREDTSTSVHWKNKSYNPQHRLLKCSECCKAFSYPSKLKRHLLTHTGEKPYNCSECDMSFNQRHILNVHLRTHTGERPYKCTECDKSFNQVGNLIVHQRTHTGERPYACSECYKSFSQINHFIAHQLVHTGERPYKCSVCHKSFSRASSFKRHQHVHT